MGSKGVLLVARTGNWSCCWWDRSKFANAFPRDVRTGSRDATWGLFVSRGTFGCVLSAVKNGSQSLDIFHAPINRSIQHLTGGKSDYTLPLILEEDWEGIKLKLNQQGKAKIRRSEFLAVSEACKALEIYGENL